MSYVIIRYRQCKRLPHANVLRGVVCRLAGVWFADTWRVSGFYLGVTRQMRWSATDDLAHNQHAYEDSEQENHTLSDEIYKSKVGDTS